MITTTTPVVFEYDWWQARYPELAGWVTPGQALGFFDRAALLLDNTPRSPVRDCDERRILLGLLVAHIAKMNAPIDGQEPSPLVGRISSASEGGVSVSTEYGGEAEPGEAWYLQTKYGAEFWAATRRFRLGRYHVGPQPFRENEFPLRRSGFRPLGGF